MSKWEMVKLGEVGTIVTGNTPSTRVAEYFENSDIPFYKPIDLSEANVNSVKKSTTYLDNRAKNKIRLLPCGSVLVTCIGIIGKVAVSNNIECATNQQINAIIPKKDVCDSKYLAYVIFSLQQYLQDKANAPVVPIINKKDFSEIEIPLPPLDEQKRIAEELDKISGLIAKRKSQLEKLDLLVKAKFVEMFGDNFPKVKASEICEFITKGTTPKSNKIFDVYKDGYVPYLKVYNLSFDGKLLFDENPQYIQKETHNNFLLRSKVYPHDVLMNIVGPPLGKFCLVPDVYSEYNINQAIAIFRAKPNIVSRYLLYALMNPKTLQPFIESAVGIRQQNISLQQCRDLEIPVPPISLQNLFADYVTKVEQTKTKLQQGLEQLETLYKARMQEYFE